MCPRCRGAIAQAARFCGFCGSALGAATVVPAPAPFAHTRTPLPPAPPVNPAEGSGAFGMLEHDQRRTLVDASPPWFVPSTVNTVEQPSQGGARVNAEELTPGTIVGEFRIECLLGMGSMGAVYGAIHPVIGRRVAVKVVRPERIDNAEATERFVREAQAASRVRHPNVVDVYTIGALPDGRAYIVMEWLDGETLRARLGRPLAIAESCRVIEHVIDALSALHDRGVVHRDLKPDNIFLVKGPEGPTAKVLDLGLAKLTERERPARTPLRLTLEGFVVGSAEYVAPEQAAGHQVDARADIYALGVVLFELFTLRRPFEGSTATDLLVEHIVQEPPAPRSLCASVPAELDRLVLRMLSKEPEDRPSLAEVRSTLGYWRMSAGANARTIVEGQAPVVHMPMPLPPPPVLTPLPAPLPITPFPPTPAASLSSTAQLPLYAERFQPAPVRRSRWWMWLLAFTVLAAAAGAFAWWRFRHGG